MVSVEMEQGIKDVIEAYKEAINLINLLTT